MIVLVDAQERENEGDLIIAADKATPEAINFMARFGRGLICLALTGERVAELALPLMPRENLSRHQTAFTVSIEAREGVSTGISAADRARTIAAAIDPTKGKSDIATPGHVFPLVAREGGVLMRGGHTEAAVDLARLAGCNPSGVICEIMNDDGTMARMPDLVKFAQYHGIKVGTIADLIAYRLRKDKLVKRAAESELDSVHGGRFRMVVYTTNVEAGEHVALVKGNVKGGDPVLVRVHAFDALGDVLGARSSRGGVLQSAMRTIASVDRGVVVLIRKAHVPSLVDRAIHAGDETAVPIAKWREIGIGSQILVDLGVRRMILLSNSKQALVGLEGYGLEVVSRRSIPVN
ncbi:MAG: 3,4-dihydroxy-2-butanone-4-phosphate synthase [Alphaproteobacteria bacterium]|nr:3,4-dihydroxy-2-butanone-4-phosphate synthase [Alphaproteobacteria bacterium]